MIPLSLALAGCHVFQVVQIDCASDEACAQPADVDVDTDTDADTDADTDTDTDTDTAPVVHPTRGFVISAISSTSGSRVGVFDPQGEQIAQWTTTLDGAAGPVAYDPVSASAVLAAGGTLIHLSAPDVVTRASIAYPDVLGLAYADGLAFVATGNGIATWDVESDTGETAPFEAPVEGLTGITVQADGSVYATDTDGGAPDVYEWTVGAAPSVRYSDFDESGARARIVFVGPDEAPYTCSAAGAFYAVADLAAGNARTVAYYSAGLTDVSACAYDPGDGSWLLFSPAAGVIRLDAQSRATVLLGSSSSYTLVRGGFY